MSEQKRTYAEAVEIRDLKINGNTLEFIKRSAKRIKKVKSIKHTEALDLAAVEAGFKNYKDCIDQFNNLK